MQLVSPLRGRSLTTLRGQKGSTENFNNMQILPCNSKEIPSLMQKGDRSKMGIIVKERPLSCTSMVQGTYYLHLQCRNEKH